MLFITNRRFLEGARSQAGRMVEFDLIDNEPGASVFFCRRHEAGAYEEVTSRPFFDRLRQSEHQQILFFVHGYNSLPEQAFASAQLLQAGCDKLSPKLIEVVPVIWPCDNDIGLVVDYWDDQAAAQLSAVAFSRALQHFAQWRQSRQDQEPCLKHMNILAHSMGNRVLTHAVNHWSESAGVQAVFRNIFLFAADIPNEALEEGEVGDAIPASARNILVYFAGDDFTLRTSKVANLKNRVLTRRLGHTGPERMERMRRNVFAIDCASFNNSYDRLGHSYYSLDRSGEPGLALRHMVGAMRTGRVPLMTDGERELILDDHSGASTERFAFAV